MSLLMQAEGRRVTHLILSQKKVDLLHVLTLRKKGQRVCVIHGVPLQIGRAVSHLTDRFFTAIHALDIGEASGRMSRAWIAVKKTCCREEQLGQGGIGFGATVPGGLRP
jgi:hypothetical protein